MKSLGILWNSSSCFKDEIKSDVKEYAKIIGTITIDLEDNYEEFVREIYAQDDIAKWKVDKKLETMFLCTSNKIINVLIMDIDVEEQYYHPHKKRMVYKNLEQMKIDIREKYSKKVPVYFFDNVFHVTDNENEFYLDYEVIKKYMKIGKVIESEFNEKTKVKKKV